MVALLRRLLARFEYNNSVYIIYNIYIYIYIFLINSSITLFEVPYYYWEDRSGIDLTRYPLYNFKAQKRKKWSLVF
jgi:hypothetical protein